MIKIKNFLNLSFVTSLILLPPLTSWAGIEDGGVGGGGGFEYTYTVSKFINYIKN